MSIDDHDDNKSRFNVVALSDQAIEDSNIKDFTLASMGIKLMKIAETELPALILLKSYNDSKTLKGANIIVSTHITPHYAVLLQSLLHFGANIRCCSCDPRTTKDEIAAALVSLGIPTFGISDMNESDYIKNFEKCLKTYKNFEPNILIDDSGDLIEYIKKNNPEIFSKLKGVIENNLFDLPRIYEIFENESINFTILNTSATLVQKTIRTNFYHEVGLIECIRAARDTIVSGCCVVIFGYGHKGKAIARTLKNHGAIVYIIEIDPICAFMAKQSGYMVTTFERVQQLASIIITCTGNKNVLSDKELENVPNNCVVLNMGASSCEIETNSLFNNPNLLTKKSSRHHFIDYVIWPNGKKIILVSQGKHAASSCCNVPTDMIAAAVVTVGVAALELFISPPGKYKPGMFLLPKKMDEYIANLYLEADGCILSELTSEQASFLQVQIQGPYKPNYYNY